LDERFDPAEFRRQRLVTSGIAVILPLVVLAFLGPPAVKERGVFYVCGSHNSPVLIVGDVLRVLSIFETV
jgi:hypothetical protein